ncbi:outer membrane protein [Bradyrhizobium sp.]|uniref:outer membrane protein n=1 Tax=Bradyrhizobium sp. TaxID=376 RepID=UPI0040382EB4
MPSVQGTTARFAFVSDKAEFASDEMLDVQFHPSRLLSGDFRQFCPVRAPNLPALRVFPHHSFSVGCVSPATAFRQELRIVAVLSLGNQCERTLLPVKLTLDLEGLNMKKLVLALAATAAFAGQAIAADMRAPIAKAPPPVVAPVASWTGCYIGGGGGYGLWNQESTQYFNNVLQVDTVTFGGRGWFGTVQGGCDYQFGGNIVVGAYADYDFSSIEGRFGVLVGNLTGNEKQSSSWSVGGRIGWLATPNLLTYFSAGYTETTFDRIDLATLGAVPTEYIGETTYQGYYIGSGLEYALSWVPGLYVKTEYRFSEFDGQRLASRNIVTNALTGDTFDVKKYSHTVRTTLSYKFNFGGPVVAKY